MMAPAGSPTGLLAALDRAGYRVTEPRRAVASLIAGHDGHFTAADLEADARERELPIGRATIFRALELFTALDLVEQVDLPQGGHAYVGCEPSHHHHVICTRCGRSTEVEDCGMSEVAAEVARRSGYRVASHRLELFGTCPECLAGEPS
jgi:Fur family ferric uptake transcriptional regulator